MQNPKWIVPASLAEGEALKAELYDVMSKIQGQLGHKTRQHPDATEYSKTEFDEWRRKVVFAYQCSMREYRRAKEWCKNQNRALGLSLHGSADLAFSPTDSESLLRASLLVLRRLASDGVDLDPEEWQLTMALQAHVEQHGRTRPVAKEST